MRDVRVLHVINELGSGGAEALVVEMVRRSADAGWVSAVASHGGRRVAELTEAGAPHYEVAMSKRTVRGLLAARRDATRAVAAFQPDVVIAHNVSASVVARLVRPVRSVIVQKPPIVTVFHGVAGSEYRAAARILRMTSNRVVTVSDTARHRLQSAGLRGLDITTIHNAVTPRTETSRHAARAALDLPQHAPIGLCVARMEHPKRHDLLLEAWHRLPPGDHLLLLAGDGSLRPRWERAARTHGDRVRFLGDRSDIATLLAAADITTLISDSEGLPMAVLESLAAGRPVVASDVGGVREILGHGGGILVPRDDVGAIAKALEELLGNEAARCRAAVQGLQVLESRHDPVDMMSKYRTVVSETLARFAS